MDCFICSKKKKDFEVWNNKIVIAATYDSEFQNDEQVQRMSNKSMICHECMQLIKTRVDEKRK